MCIPACITTWGSYWESGSTTMNLAPQSPQNHSPLFGALCLGVCDAWRRGLLAAPYKKCYVRRGLSRAVRCRAPDPTRKFGGYMEGGLKGSLFPWGSEG